MAGAAGVQWEQFRPTGEDRNMKTWNLLKCWERTDLPKGKEIKVLRQFYVSVMGQTGQPQVHCGQISILTNLAMENKFNLQFYR